MIMQGLDMPDIGLRSSSEFPPPMTHLLSPPSAPMDPLLFEEPKDIYGWARVQTGSTSLVRTTSDPPSIDTIASTSTMASTSTITEIYSDASTPLITVSPAEVLVPAETDDTSSAVTIISPASTNFISFFIRFYSALIICIYT